MNIGSLRPEPPCTTGTRSTGCLPTVTSRFLAEDLRGIGRSHLHRRLELPLLLYISHPSPDDRGRLGFEVHWHMMTLYTVGDPIGVLPAIPAYLDTLVTPTTSWRLEYRYQAIFPLREAEVSWLRRIRPKGKVVLLRLRLDLILSVLRLVREVNDAQNGMTTWSRVGQRRMVMEATMEISAGTWEKRVLAGLSCGA